MAKKMPEAKKAGKGKGGKKAGPKAATKMVIYRTLAEELNLKTGQVGDFFTHLEAYIKRELGPTGPGVFTIPGLLKIRKTIKPATKERTGRDPRTGNEITIKAKPERTVVKAMALKNLKEMVK